MKILLATARANDLESFVSELSLEKNDPLLAESVQEVLDIVPKQKPSLIIIDENLSGPETFKLIQNILSLDAMVNTAVLTDMDKKDFHEAGEGLGILMSLPLNPGKEDGRELISNLKQVL
ncbi:MAG: hypothetical protein ABR542_00815 [Desulfonatronovibrio sp.]|nr:hypothetical protein [Desulfovibrionales bacterium]